MVMHMQKLSNQNLSALKAKSLQCFLPHANHQAGYGDDSGTDAGDGDKWMCAEVKYLLFQAGWHASFFCENLCMH